MKNNRTKRFALSLLSTIVVSASHAQVRPATLEYWFDRQYAKHQTVNTNGNFSQNIDVSNLCYGIHTLEMRVSDTKGRWGGTLLKYFLKTDPTIANNKLTTYEYWIDDYCNVKSGTTSDGNIILDIDVTSLCKGIHTFCYQVQYSNGRKSSPRLVYFLVPDLEMGADMIAAYEYWFNHGKRTRVEQQPASPTMSLSDVMIEVKDVVPNTLKGYRFDASTEQAEVDDNVFFGMQVYNANNRGSVAVLSDTFQMAVPVELNMLNLDDNSESQTVNAPNGGRMQGVKSASAIGDSLTYTLSSQNVNVDFYDANGNRLNAEKTLLETGEVTYTLEATTAITYALLYDASDVLDTITVSLSASEATGLDAISLFNDATEVVRYNTNGQVIKSPQRGINIIRMSDGTTHKVIVK